jgi:hypothetical protein
MVQVECKFGAGDCLRRTSEQVEDIVFLGLNARLAKALLHLYEHSLSNSRQGLIGDATRNQSTDRRLPREREQIIAHLGVPKVGRLDRGKLSILSLDTLKRLISANIE